MSTVAKHCRPTREHIDKDELVSLRQLSHRIRVLMNNAGSARALGEELGLSENTIYDAVNGRRNTVRVARALGYERVMMYRKVKKDMSKDYKIDLPKGH